jgi:hypothetical protein
MGLNIFSGISSLDLFAVQIAVQALGRHEILGRSTDKHDSDRRGRSDLRHEIAKDAKRLGFVQAVQHPEEGFIEFESEKDTFEQLIPYHPILLRFKGHAEVLVSRGQR